MSVGGSVGWEVENRDVLESENRHWRHLPLLELADFCLIPTGGAQAPLWPGLASTFWLLLGTPAEVSAVAAEWICLGRKAGACSWEVTGFGLCHYLEKESP